MKRLIVLLTAIGLGVGVASAQDSKFGTAAEARAMLDKAVAAVKADKENALKLFNKGEPGFKDRDLQPFCFDAATGTLLAVTHPKLLGGDVRNLKDTAGKEFGKELFAAAVDGQVSEVVYMFARPGSDLPTKKMSFVTGVEGLGCGVGYFLD
ncbi:MAG: cache domain-containing protein [Hyphomicrobiaceae bacterium]